MSSDSTTRLWTFERGGGIAGVVAAVLMFVAAVLGDTPDEGSATDQRLVDFYTDSGTQARLYVAVLVGFAAGLLFLWFLVGVRDRFARVEPSGLPSHVRVREPSRDPSELTGLGAAVENQHLALDDDPHLRRRQRRPRQVEVVEENVVDASPRGVEPAEPLDLDSRPRHRLGECGERVRTVLEVDDDVGRDLYLHANAQ